jgi:serine/threonine-protein kinase RsbW
LAASWTPRMIIDKAPVQRDVVIPSDMTAVREIQTEIEEGLQRFGFEESEAFSIKMAVEEAVVNAIKHGNQFDPAKTVTVRYSIDLDVFQVSVTDQGPGFDPEDVPDPTAPENLERPCGRGLLLMRYYMNEVNIQDGGNTIVMSRQRGKS